MKRKAPRGTGDKSECSHCGKFLAISTCKAHITQYWNTKQQQWKETLNNLPLKPAITPSVIVQHSRRRNLDDSRSQSQPSFYSESHRYPNYQSSVEQKERNNAGVANNSDYKLPNSAPHEDAVVSGGDGSDLDMHGSGQEDAQENALSPPPTTPTPTKGFHGFPP